jgi:hypothetical protein
MQVGGNNNDPQATKITEKKAIDTDIKKLFSEAQEDGIITPEERDKIFQAGYKIKDESQFQELKQGISTDFEDISKAFEEGHEAAKREEMVSNLVHDLNYGKVSEDLNKEAKGEQNHFRKMAGWLEGEAGSFEKGLHELGKPADPAQNIEPLGAFKTGLKSLAGFAGDGLGAVKKGLHDLSLPDAKQNEINAKAESQAEAAGEKGREAFVSKKEEIVKVSYVKKEADLVNCVIDALKEIGFKNVKKTGVININEELLKKMTGKNWDAIDIANTDTDKLKEYLKGKEGKALVSDGGHAYVYAGINEVTGNIRVSDATVKISKEISKENTAATVFVQGKGDGSITGKAAGDKNIQLFKDVNKLVNINSVDKTNGAQNESWQIRKMLVLFSDPTQAKVIRNIADAVKLNDYAKVAEILNSRGIKLDDREVRAMTTILNARIDDQGKSTTMMDKFLWLNKGAEGNITEKQTNYIKAVEYSNVDLNNYFSSATQAGERAKNMLTVLNDIIAGGEGC